MNVVQGQNGDSRPTGSTHRQYIAAFLGALSGFCVGMDMGWSSPMTPLLTSPDTPVGSEPLTLENMAWLSSVSFVGSVVGSLFWGQLADRIGRKTTACIVALPHIISWIILFFAENFTWIFIGRFVVGVGNSGTVVTAAVFITEISQDSLRGFLGCLYKVLLNAGILYAYILGPYLGYHGLALCCLVVPVVFLLTFVWLPETPLFYWKNGQPDKAEKSLLWYRCGDVYATETTLLTYKSFQNNKTSPSFKDLVSTRGRVKALLTAVLLTVAYQTTGVYPIMFFAVTIFQMSGASFSSYQSAIIFASCKLVFAIFCSLLVDRCGRKILIVGSLACISVSLITLATCLFLFQDTGNPVLNFLPVICLSVHVMAFSVGLGSISTLYKSEMFPPEIRGLAMAKLLMLLDLSTFANLQLFPTLNTYLNLYGVFWLYGVSSLFFSLLFSVILLETKRKPQSVIVKMFNGEELTAEELQLDGSFQKKTRNQCVTVIANKTSVNT